MRAVKLKDPQRAAGIAYTLSAIFPLILGAAYLILLQILKRDINEAQETNGFIVASFLISQISFLAVILIINNRYEGALQKARPPKAKYYLIAVLLAAGLFYGLSYLNIFFVDFLEKLGLKPPEVSVPNLHDNKMFALSILVIAVLPAIVEEILFRKILLSGLKKYGTLGAVLISGALFSLFHQNPSQTVYQFISGALFALLAIKSGSIIPSIIIHFINNAYVLVTERWLLQFHSNIHVLVIIAAVLLTVCVTVYLCLQKSPSSERENKGGRFFIYALPGIILCAVVWVVGLF